MPKIKISDRDRKKMVMVKERCPCIQKALLAEIFDISPSRVGEILREEEAKRDKRN